MTVLCVPTTWRRSNDRRHRTPCIHGGSTLYTLFQQFAVATPGVCVELAFNKTVFWLLAPLVVDSIRIG